MTMQVQLSILALSFTGPLQARSKEGQALVPPTHGTESPLNLQQCSQLWLNMTSIALTKFPPSWKGPTSSPPTWFTYAATYQAPCKASEPGCE